MACLSNLNTLNPPELTGLYTQNIVHMDPYGRHMVVSSSSSFHLAMPNIYNLRRRWKLDEIGNLCKQSMIDQYLCSLYIMFGVFFKREHHQWTYLTVDVAVRPSLSEKEHFSRKQPFFLFKHV
jgi:hypothetical protein